MVLLYLHLVRGNLAKESLLLKIQVVNERRRPIGLFERAFDNVNRAEPTRLVPTPLFVYFYINYLNCVYVCLRQHTFHFFDLHDFILTRFILRLRYAYSDKAIPNIYSAD